jgi:hypothetical protein
MNVKTVLIVLLVLFLMGVGCVQPRAVEPGVTFSIEVNDPLNISVGYTDQLEKCLLAAANEWGRHIAGKASIEIELSFQYHPTAVAMASPGSSVFLRYEDGVRLYSWSTLEEIITGVDQNGDDPDAEIIVNPHCFSSMYFSPFPRRGRAFVPYDKYDTYSILLHELGHTLAFCGWYGHTVSEMMGYQSIYDKHIEEDEDGNLRFVGKRSREIVPGGIPLNRYSPAHTDAERSLMYAYVQKGKKLRVTNLELAILEDCGMPIVGRPWRRPVNRWAPPPDDWHPPIYYEEMTNGHGPYQGMCGTAFRVDTVPLVRELPGRLWAGHHQVQDFPHD